MQSKERPYVLYVAEIIYLEVSEIKRKIPIIQIQTQLKILSEVKFIKKLVAVNFMMNGFVNQKKMILLIKKQKKRYLLKLYDY